jgi:2-polyprenyl-6-hydroxyphenyl methylase/3-demethylubiquinone-9 3-methyltransferase
LHDLNPARLDYVREFAPLKGARVLDLGCGGGLLSEALAREGANVVGIDLASDVVEVAKLHLHESGQQVELPRDQRRSARRRRARSFDLVCCMEMLEHVPDPASVIAEQRCGC